MAHHQVRRQKNEYSDEYHRKDDRHGAAPLSSSIPLLI
jgi:hypothetical protein